MSTVGLNSEKKLRSNAPDQHAPSEHLSESNMALSTKYPPEVVDKLRQREAQRAIDHSEVAQIETGISQSPSAEVTPKRGDSYGPTSVNYALGELQDFLDVIAHRDVSDKRPRDTTQGESKGDRADRPDQPMTTEHKENPSGAKEHAANFPSKATKLISNLDDEDDLLA